MSAIEERFENFTLSVLKLNKLVQKIKLFEMDGYGLKAIHVMCIYYAGTASVTAGELCRMTYEDKGAISRALSLLKSKGFVDYDGKYNAEIVLTQQGRQLYEHIRGRAEAAVLAAVSNISEEERNVFNKVLASLSANLENYYNLLKKAER